MMHILIFNLLLAVSCLYAIFRGGAPERVAAFVYLAAAVSTTLLPYQNGRSFGGVESFYLLIDCAVLAAIGTLSLRADRFWPLWSASIQAVGITIHGAKAFEPSIMAYVYFITTSNLAYPMLVMLALGTFRHRQRIARFGSDTSWSPWRETADERRISEQAGGE